MSYPARSATFHGAGLHTDPSVALVNIAYSELYKVGLLIISVLYKAVMDRKESFAFNRLEEVSVLNLTREFTFAALHRGYQVTS